MKPILPVLAAFALSVAAAAPAAGAGVPAKRAHKAVAAAPVSESRGDEPDARKAVVRLDGPEAATKAPADPVAAASADVRRVADWIAASGDNRGLPYIIVDKKAAQLQLYTAEGELVGVQPVLLGISRGDQATPGVGSKDLAQIGTAEKTTPAGRFLARFGLAAGRNKVLWVDYADSVALHPIPPTANPREQRRQRMLSPASDDNRITFGCINVPKALYTRNVVPLFRKQGGYVYVLPDELPLDDVFPLLRTRPFNQTLRDHAGGETGHERAFGPQITR